MTKTLSVLLIDDNPACADIVEAGLRSAGCILLARLDGTHDLTARAGALQPDVIVVRQSRFDWRDATPNGSTSANAGRITAYPGEEINDRLVALAHAGKSVVRLKGGDPFVFGRGGEEIESLTLAGVAVEVVPGVTAALDRAASAGIPLTHRDPAQACVFVTGHLKDGSIDLDWQMLARPRQTVVICMGAETLPVIASRLIQHGLPAATPVALIENGTTNRERRVVGTLATIERRARHARLTGPTLCLVGEVVGLAVARSGEAKPREFRFESRVSL